MCRTGFDFYGKRDFDSKFEAFGSPKAWTWLCLDLNEACNYDCVYCFTNSSTQSASSHLSFAEIRSIVDQAVDIGLKQVSLLGGEPMLRDDLLEIAQYITSREVIVHMCSNGSFIDKEIARLLRDSGITQVQINIDHTTAEIHDYIRGKPGSFRKAREAIDSLLGVDMPVVTATVVLSHNFEVIPNLLRLSRQWGVNGYRIWDFIPSGRGKSNKSLAIGSYQYRKLLLDLLDIASELEIPFVRSGEPLLATIPGVTQKILYTPCPAGTLMYSIAADGEVHICSMDREASAGNVRQQPLDQILESEEFANIIADRFQAEGCDGCQYLSTCRYGCKLRIDSQLDKDAKCWL
jgi:radical SAM protein with 4Fe4S-binding SPASM domain